ncbi:MAG: HAD-IIIA family hydrolase [Actinomycetota bacterium]|nr:HAD-IIIA family hydrolase [Actinomycetota bacterium]
MTATIEVDPPMLVLFDRDGTLVDDVPYNGDPDLVTTVPDACAALTALRRRGIAVGMVTNQSGVARGLIDRAAVDRVNARVASLLGPFDTIQVCPHGPWSGCECRKPRPGMILAAAAELEIPVDRCAVVGDIEGDVVAGQHAGARSILVPNAATRRDEILVAPEVAPSLTAAVELLLHRRVVPARPGARPDQLL